MKYFVIFFVLVGIFATLAIPPIYAPPEPDPESAFKFSDYVITGKVISSKVIPDMREDTPQVTYVDKVVYEIQVLEWYKNPLSNSTITVYGEHHPNNVVPEPMWGIVEFEIGDTVYLYLQETEEGLKFLAYESKLIKHSSKNILSPLKQFNSGIPFGEIQCRNNLQLTQRYDGTPACVKPETKSKLEKRGWTEFDKSKMTELFKNLPEVKEFYAVYGDADVSVKEDHMSYFAGSEDDYFARMNIFFDKNHALDHIDFNCYFQKSHQFELAQEDIISKLKKYECKEIPKSEPEPEPMSDVETQLYDAKKSLKEAYQNHVNLGPYYMRDVIVGFGTNDDSLVIDIPSKYTDQNSIRIIKKEIRHVVGDQVKVDYVVYDESIERHIEIAIPYLWNKILHQNKIDFTPKNQTYWNNADGFADHDKVCSPLVSPNGTEFFISSTFNLEPFEITGTYIDKTEPDGCHKIWKTNTIMQEPDRVIALWLENEN